MMLRPIEFDTSRDPRSGQADERRLDHLLMINDIVVVIGLILDRVNPPAKVGQD